MFRKGVISGLLERRLYGVRSVLAICSTCLVPLESDLARLSSVCPKCKTTKKL